MISIQYQDQTGNWTTVMVTENFSQNIMNAMNQVKDQYDRRVRAIDDSGRIVDIL
jgi:hypothetical protein